MKKKKVFILMLATMLAFSFVATSAWAGPKQRYRWEGVAIGLGAAILGQALFNSCYYSQPAPAPVVYYSSPPVYFTPPVVYYGRTVVRNGPPPWRHHRHCRPHHPRRYRGW